MNLALAAARHSPVRGDPVGAVIVDPTKQLVVATQTNSSVSRLAHATIECIRLVGRNETERTTHSSWCLTNPFIVFS